MVSVDLFMVFQF